MAEDRRLNAAMVVVAHADDAEFGCSGTVAKWCNEGIEVVYVLCTDGSKGSSDRGITSKELAGTRHEEQVNAGKTLGLSGVVFLDYDDSMLQPTLEVRRDIARQIRIYRPDVLVTTCPVRDPSSVGHPDHLAAGEAAFAAVFPTARDHLTFPELLDEGLEPHKVAEVWVMGHPQPDLWIDVTEHMEKSISALRQHVSQLRDSTEEEIREKMLDWRSRNAEGKDMKYSEAFRRIVVGRPLAQKKIVEGQG